MTLPYTNPTTVEQVATNVREIGRILDLFYHADETRMYRFRWIDSGATKVLKIQTKLKTENDDGWTNWTP